MAISYEKEEVPLDGVTENPDNDFSMDEAGIRELASSIERDGLGQLPLVRRMGDGTLMLISGHRRLAAYKLLRDAHPSDPRWERIPVNVATGMGDTQAKALLAVTNLETRQIPSEERTRRIVQLMETIPDIRRERPDLAGVGSTKIAADILSEGGVNISESVVRSVYYRERKRRENMREAVSATEGLDPDVAPTMRTAAEASKVDATDVKRMASLPPRLQMSALVDYQRLGGGKAALRRAVDKASRVSDSETGAGLDRAATRTIESLESLLARLTARSGKPLRLPEGTAERIEELAVEISRTQLGDERGSQDPDSLI